uniref:GST C-terminal domain-containing protein n=1 Tax=Cebus imitator TaxID=2715852 RepID=A0A2K5SI73_CEBIM
MHHNKQATENAKEEARRILGLLNAHLKTRTFLVGERVTLADIIVVCALLWLYKQVLEPSFCQAFPNTNRWFLTCINQPQFRAVLGEKMAQFDAKKFAETQPKRDTPRKEKGSREEKQKPQGEQKEEKKAAAPAPEEEMDECEQALAAEPKAKDPFAHLPKSTFVLDEFKRKYSNEDTLSVALPYFREHFDKDCWSLWHSEYHFPEELTQTFMSCNLITESYTWRKLDPGSEEAQTLVREYFSWEGASSMWAKPLIRVRSSSEHLLPSPCCLHLPFREMGVIKGN